MFENAITSRPEDFRPVTLADFSHASMCDGSGYTRDDGVYIDHFVANWGRPTESEAWDCIYNIRRDYKLNDPKSTNNWYEFRAYVDRRVENGKVSYVPVIDRYKLPG